VFADRGVNQQGLRMAGSNHRIQVAVEKACVQMKLVCVPMAERSVCIHYAHQLDLMLIRELFEEPAHVSVLESDNGDS
jgi:hypothetical protein